MAFKLAEAYVEFSQKGVNAVRSGVDKVKGSFSGAATSAKLLSGAVAAIGTAGALRGLMSFVQAAAEAERQTAKLEAVLKTTNGVSGQTIESLEAHASALQKVTAFEDDTIKGAQAVLLTFKKIGGETFPAATEAALDLATVFEGDLRGAAMMVGKALEDPVRGITALRRAGVSFTKDQQDVIKSLVETGKAAEAQAMILKEIQGQVGGSARKVGDTTFGQLEQLRNAAGDAAEEIGALLVPAVQAATAALRSLTAGSVPLSPGDRAANRAKVSAEFANLSQQVMGARSQSDARAAMGRLNSLMVDMAREGVDPAQFEFVHKKLLDSTRRRMGSLPEFTDEQLQAQRDQASRTADERYRTSQEKVARDLRMQDMTKSVNEWESLRNLDFGAFEKSLESQKRQEELAKQQVDHLKAIQQELSYRELLNAMAARYE